MFLPPKKNFMRFSFLKTGLVFKSANTVIKVDYARKFEIILTSDD